MKPLCLCVSVLICALAVAQPKPRIDFDQLLRQFPDLPWNFEVRYVVHNGTNTHMLRLYHDQRADLVRWRPGDPGSLAQVCHANVDEKTLRKLLELLRDKHFNDLASDNESVMTVAERGDATVSVREGKTVVRKIDRHERDNPELAAIEDALDSIQTMIAADPKTKCAVESVPARP